MSSAPEPEEPAAPTREEAAAIAAAIERFLAETTAPMVPPPAREAGWGRAVLLRGTAGPDWPREPWGDSEPWGRAPEPPRR